MSLFVMVGSKKVEVPPKADKKGRRIPYTDDELVKAVAKAGGVSEAEAKKACFPPKKKKGD